MGAESADKLAKLVSKCPFKGPEPACIITVRITQKAVSTTQNLHKACHYDSLVTVVICCA
jgi:hypothetical protein